MDNRIHEAFDKIHAEEPLKQKTVDFLHQRIQRQTRKRYLSHLSIVTACAAFALLFIIGGFSYNLYVTPNAYVDIDVNPSIEFAVNRFGRVIEAAPYNDDGAAILKKINFRHMRYKDAVDQLIGVMAANGYLQQNELLSITVQTNKDDKKSSMINSLQSVIDNALQNHQASATTNVFLVSEEVKTHSHENHMSPAKYLAISALQKIDPTVTFENSQDHAISEINEMIQAHDSVHHSTTIKNDSGDTLQNQYENWGEHGGGHH